MEVKIRAFAWGSWDEFKKELELFVKNAEFENSWRQRAFEYFLEELNTKSIFSYVNEDLLFARTDLTLPTTSTERGYREYEFLNGWVSMYFKS
ncbi:MAG: hypothetical protein KatS3mg002_0278 [Candidatus Woesearchaeota archaeon]|nr:MAG: hypothetical protein KatS3mg002_0278 [Candidatus Woesearchaeota archaeon]